MAEKPTYEELRQRVEELEGEDLRHRQLEKAFNENKKKYRLLIKNLPCVVYRGYEDFSVEFFDNKIELFTGTHMNDFNAKRVKWSDVIVKEDIEAAKLVFIQALKADKSYVREYRIKTRSGGINWIQERGQIVCNEKGEIEYVSGVFFDITDYKRAEQERIHSEKLKSILEMAGAVCHEMNQPIQAVYLNLEELLRKKAENESVYKGVGIVKEKIDKLASITRKLQRITRYETKEYILGTKIIDIEKSSTKPA